MAVQHFTTLFHSPEAVVGLEMTYTTVMEDVGTVEVYVAVFTHNSMFLCPTAFPLTADITAGKIKKSTSKN